MSYETAFSNAFSVNENAWILNKISLKCIPECPIVNKSALVQTMVYYLFAITWINVYQVSWCNLALLGVNELIYGIYPNIRL